MLKRVLRKKAPTQVQSSSPPTAEDATPFVRIVFAASLLIVSYYSTPSPVTHENLFNLALTFYCLYSVVHCLPGQSRFNQLVRQQAHWIDVGWFGLFLMLGTGTSLSLLLGFSFATIVASFRRTGRTALLVAIVSLILIVADRIYEVSSVALPTEALAESSSFLVHSSFLLLLGFLLFYRGDVERLLERRLSLIKDVMALSNPRFGVDRTIGSVMEKLRAFYDADACVLVMANSESSQYELRRSDRCDPEKAIYPEEIGAELARQLLVVPGAQAVLYDQARTWPGSNKLYEVPEPKSNGHKNEALKRYDDLATLLDAKSFVTVPVRYHNGEAGRLFVTTQRLRTFRKWDIDFLSQVIHHILPVIENIRLVDSLALDAAEHERKRIARDIHDSVIQPYIGIQMGLGAVRQKLERGSLDVNHDLERLIEMTQAEIHGLRSYVGGLSEAQDRQVSLLQAVKRFAERFTGATGITVEIKVETDMRVNDRLAAEVFQLVAEGLSNVRRHTQASRSLIMMGCKRGHFHLHIGNETKNGSSTRTFIPKSITARTASLGGRVHIENAMNGWTLLNIDIPL